MQATVQELTTEQRNKVTGFLREHPVGVLASTNADGSPQASTVYIGCDDDLRVTFTTKQDTQKYQNIKRDNRVVLVAFEAASQTSMQLYGRAVEVEDQTEAQRIFRATVGAAGRTGGDIVPPIAKVAAGPYAGFVIEIDAVKLSEYSWGDSFTKAFEHADKPHATGDPA